MLPAWRRRVMPLLMGGLRLAILWAIFRGPSVFLWAPPAFLHVPTLPRALYAVAMVAGIPLFLWPRFCAIGGLFLVAAVGVYEWLWRGAGLPPGGMPWLAVALIAVLVLGQQITAIAQRRLYRQDAD
jgi:hypothetical protein